MDNLSLPSLTLCTTKAGLAAGTTTTTTTGATVIFCIKGKAYSAAAASNATTPTLDSNTGAAFLPIAVNKASVFVICLDSGGALRAVQGSMVDYSDAGIFAFAPQFPVVPDTLCAIGYEIVKIISTGSTWTFGVSNQAAQTGITKTFTDCMTIPDRPQII